jgi:hypothetical protein
MSDLKAAIRKALAKSTSQNPVDTEELMKLGAEIGVRVALVEMYAEREINTAKVIKNGSTTVLCWLTGALTTAPAFAINRPPTPAERPFSQPVLKPQSAPGGKMNAPKGSAGTPAHTPSPITQAMNRLLPGKVAPRRNCGRPPTSPIRQAIYNIVTKQPGIGIQALLEQALSETPEATEKQARKAIENLIYYSKRVRAEGGHSKRKLFPADEQATPEKEAGTAPANPEREDAYDAAARVRVEREQATITKSPADLVKSVSIAPLPAAPADEFDIMVTEQGKVQVSIGRDRLALSIAQCQRLSRFVTRITEAFQR